MTTLPAPYTAPVARSTAWAAAVAWSAAVGLVAGVVVGTVIWPIVVACLYAFVGALCGAVLGNVVSPVFVRLRSSRTTAALAVLGRCLAVASIGGAAIGGVVGLVLGLAANPPTAPFAIIEGAVLATPTAAALGVLVALVAVLLPRDRTRQPAATG